MKLIEILNKYSDTEILKRLLNLYPDEKKNLAGYLDALDEMRHTKVSKSNSQIKIRLQKDDDGEEYFQVGTLKDGEEYSASFIDWNQFLGMEVIPFKELSDLDTLVHCLWEMTFYGYTNKDTQELFNSITKDVEEIDKKIEGKGLK